MATSAKGHLAVFGLVKASAWNTAVLVAAGHGLALGPGGEGITTIAELIPDDSLEGRHQELEGDRGNVTSGGDIPDMPAVFDFIHRPLAFTLGTAGVPDAVITIVTGVNDKLDINEATTGDAAATIPAGVYSRTELAAAIQTAINAAATDNTYTVDFGVTAVNKFSIVRATGTVAINLEWQSGPNTATSIGTTIGFDVGADDTGATTYSADNDSAPTANRHILKPAQTLEGLMATFVVALPSIGVKQYNTIKFGGYTYNIPNSAKQNFTFPVIASDVTYDDSGVNKIATIAGITRPGARTKGLFRQTKIRMNAKAGAALSDSDLLAITSFNQALTNNFPTDDFTTLLGDLIDEPVRDNKILLSGAIEFSKLQDNLNGLITGLARTPQKATVRTTGPTIEGQTKYAINCYYPSIQFEEQAPVSGPGRVARTRNYAAQAVEAIPSGFPAGYTDAVTIEVVNTSSTDPLA